MLIQPTVSSSPAVGYRLTPGYHFLPGESGWLLYRPDGCFARLRIPSESAKKIAAVLAGEPPLLDADDDDLTRLLSLLVAEGAAERVDSDSARSPATRRVAIEGDGEVAHQLKDILVRQGHDAVLDASRPVGSENQAEGADAPELWVSCAGWLPDKRFQETDAWCFDKGVAWHGFYAEGGRFHLGPFWLPDDSRTVRYADARARRLSAEVHPEGLQAYWRYLEAGRRVNPAQPPNSAEAAIIAGALATDILAWSNGDTPPSHGHQLAYERATGHWRRHPVLPVPRGLMTEKMP